MWLHNKRKYKDVNGEEKRNEPTLVYKMISEENTGVMVKKTVEENNVAQRKYKGKAFCERRKEQQLKSKHNPDYNTEHTTV